MTVASPSVRRQLLRAVHERRDPTARDRLIGDHLTLVRAMARRYAGRSEEYEDLVQVGTIGLIKAIDRFDLERGVEFQTYAIPMIIGEIKRHFRDRSWAVRMPRRLINLSLELRALDDWLGGALGRSPTIAELAQAAGVETEEATAAILAGKAHTAVSLSAPAPNDPDTELGDTLADPDAVFSAADDRDFIARGLESLPARERRIIELRFFGELTQSQIAQQIGISQMQVSRLIRRSLEQIAH